MGQGNQLRGNGVVRRRRDGVQRKLDPPYACDSFDGHPFVRPRSISMKPRLRPRPIPLRKRLLSLWPHAPMAIVMMAVGGLNVLDGLHVPLMILAKSRTLNVVAQSLSALGGTPQIILGLLMVLAGIGCLWRIVSSWIMSVLLLLVAVGVDVAREAWGLSLVLEGLLLVSFLVAKPHFRRRTAVANALYSLSGVLAVLAYGIFGSYLLGGGFVPQIHDYGTATYFTVVTLSTVGYGDIVPKTHEARWFVISLLVIGLGVFASAIASTLGPKISGELQRLFKPKGNNVEHKDHVILVGEGAIALNTATELKERRVPFVQIVSSRAEAAADETHTVVEGDASDDQVLRKAGIASARMVIAARDDDGENAFISLVAKDLNPEVKTLAVASSAMSIRRLKLARADLVFSPAAVGSRLMADLVEGNQISSAFEDLLEGHPKKG